MGKHGRRHVLAPALTIAALAVLLSCLFAAPAAQGSHRTRARATSQRSLKVDDHASLHLVKASGSVLIEEGYSSGTLPGRTWVRMVLGSSVQASFTIWTKGGSISGRGGATLHSSSRYASFGGWLSVASGTGRFARAHGSGKLYGVLDRRTHALTVQTIGTLSY
jgi:hypothetical protein